jgi:hypothetical protein
LWLTDKRLQLGRISNPEQGDHFRHQWHHVMELGALGVQNDNGDLILRHVLLKIEVPVARDQ